MRPNPSPLPQRFSFRSPLSLAGGAVFLLCVWGFLEITEDYPEGRYRGIDATILRALRSAADPAIPLGPLWLKDVMRDISALGSGAVLTLIAVCVLGYLLPRRRWADAIAIFSVSAGGLLLNLGLKAIAHRPRPDVVPHLAEVTSSSFPSGHSMLSAIIYLSLGVMLSRSFELRSVRIYVIAVAIVLAFLVGLSRIYLGVHYPTDVLAGWAAGTAWTLLCLAAMAYFNRSATQRSL